MCGNMDGGRVTHIGRVDFRNDNRLFGIKHEDRFSHVYIIGKTGTGKSTLLETMNGFALIDPHGDLFERVISDQSRTNRETINRLWAVLDDPHLNQALGLPQQSRMTRR